jgi:hypothetical protein
MPARPRAIILTDFIVENQFRSATHAERIAAARRHRSMLRLPAALAVVAPHPPSIRLPARRKP